DLLRPHAAHDIRLRLVGIGISGQNLVGELVRAAVLRAAQSADAAADRAVQVRAGAGDDAAGEGAGVEFMLGVEEERSVHRARSGMFSNAERSSRGSARSD